jgi:tetratricopeptide (TPR) repeat protein
MQSLESALRYNPNSIDLMASLAEVYIRMGRFDERTMDLCETVLRQQMDNALLRQAQSIGLLIDQSRAIEAGLKAEQTAPDSETLTSSIAILDEFLAQSPECVDGWIAWTRFQFLVGNVAEARRGIRRLNEIEVPDLHVLFRNSLEFAAGNNEMSPEQAQQLVEIYHLLKAEPQVLTLFEKLYDGGQPGVARALLDTYLEHYDPSRPQDVPDEVRNRFFRLLLDHAEHDLTGRWLRQASIHGWNVSEYSKDYARTLVDEDHLTEAFAMLQQLALDGDVRELLNRIAHRFEEREEVDAAVSVLRFLNDHSLADPSESDRRETELMRDTELSMAELHLRNGRYAEALTKFTNVLCMKPSLDQAVLDQIEELLAVLSDPPAEPLLRLGIYFRHLDDNPQAMSYLTQALEAEPHNKEVVEELEGFYKEILAENPQLPKLRLELGRIYRTQGRLDEAIEQLTQAAASPHLVGEVNRQTSEIYFRQGRYQEALEKYRVTAIAEGDFSNLYQIHNELLARNAPREALMALELIARVNPGWTDVTEKMAALEEQVGKLGPETGADPKMRELIGDLAIGRYQYLDRLGSGGMGVVYKVFDLRNRIPVAMKILRDSLTGSSKALDRFFREARIAATLNHNNIVKIHDYNISNLAGQSYIVMEYVDGPSLREIIDKQFQAGDPIDLRYITEVLFYCIQLADALNATHQNGIIHRDIKPDNIMINTEGEVKITDFGIVHIEEATFTPSGAMLGTPRYMSPEQVTGGRIDGRSDIYSVGILMYETLVGSPPFMSGDISYQQVHKKGAPPRELCPTIPQSVNDLIMTCLSKKPEDRQPNARVLMGELTQILDDLGGCAKYNMQNVTQVAECNPNLSTPGTKGDRALAELDEEFDLH